MAARAVDYLPQARGETVVGGGKPKKKSSAAERRTVRAPKEIGKISTIQGTDPNPNCQITRDYRRQLNAQAAAAAHDIIDLECSDDELRQADNSSFDFGKIVHQTTHVHVIDLDSSEDEESVAVNSKFSSAAVVKVAKQIDVIDLQSSEDEQSLKESIGDHCPNSNVSVEGTLMIPESNSVESTINNEACEVENLQAQSEMTNGVAVESVTVESLHADNLTSAMTEQVQVNEHYVFDCSDYETEGWTENVVCGLGTVSDNTASEEKNKPEIGVSDNIGEVMVDFKYEEVDQQDEAPADIKDLDEKGQLQTGALVDLDQDYVKLCEHLHAQTEIPTGADVEFVTLDALHYDNMFASKEGVCFDHGTMFDYDVLGNTMETISEVESFEEKDQSQIGAADDNEEIEVDLNYKVDEEGEVEDGIESLEEKDLSETEFKVSMVNVVAISILISALISVSIGSTASSYVKKGNSSTLNLVISICQQALPNKQFNASPDVPCSTIHIFQDIPSSWNWIKEPLNSKLSNLQKSSSYRLMGQDASAKHEIQQKRGATAVCQQPLLTKLNTSLIMPVGTKHKIHKRPSSWNWITESCHSEMSSLQNSSYQTQGLNELYKSENQEKSDSGKTIEERPWLQWTPQWAHCLYGSSKTIDKNTIKNGHGNDEFVAPQWAQRLYGSFANHETYPIKNRHADEEVITPQPYYSSTSQSLWEFYNRKYFQSRMRCGDMRVKRFLFLLAQVE